MVRMELIIKSAFCAMNWLARVSGPDYMNSLGQCLFRDGPILKLRLAGDHIRRFIALRDLLPAVAKG